MMVFELHVFVPLPKGCEFIWPDTNACGISQHELRQIRYATGATI